VTPHTLLRTNAFVRAAKRIVKRRPELAEDIATALTQLASHPQHPSLKTHKLTGELAGSWACSAGYDLRIIFNFTKHAGKPAILLETIGTHDEVY
jgi:mRNA-degrading endonuclease YafQ of YafQ-DinJ toxin-antitoxin module